MCETLYKEYDAVEDHPECETVEKAECDTSRCVAFPSPSPVSVVLLELSKLFDPTVTRTTPTARR